MKTIAYNFLRVIAMLVAVMLGSLFFLISFIVGIAHGHRSGVYAATLVLTIGITLLSFWHPETFRIGPVDLKIHDSVWIDGFPPLIANLAKNVAFSYLGVAVGKAARDGYNDGRSNPQACY